MNGRRFLTILMVACALCAVGCRTLRSTADNPAELAEDPPAGVKFALTAESLGELREIAKPDLFWKDADGAPMFLWVKPGSDVAHVAFEMTQAYHVTQNGRRFWCFLEGRALEQTSIDDPVVQFLLWKFFKEEIAALNYHPDFNCSYADVLSTNRDGAIVVKLVYSSDSGVRANQEQIKTYLLCRSRSGQWALAAGDLGHEGGYAPGSWGGHDGFEFDVDWRDGHAERPIQVHLRKWTYRFIVNSDVEHTDLQTYCDGTLSGSLPMKVKWSAGTYCESNGKQSLKSIAADFAADCNLLDESAAHQSEAVGIWLAELEKLNPGLQHEIPISSKVRITLPNEAATDDLILKRLASMSPDH